MQAPPCIAVPRDTDVVQVSGLRQCFAKPCMIQAEGRRGKKPPKKNQRNAQIQRGSQKQKKGERGKPGAAGAHGSCTSGEGAPGEGARRVQGRNGKAQGLDWHASALGPPPPLQLVLLSLLLPVNSGRCASSTVHWSATRSQGTCSALASASPGPDRTREKNQKDRKKKKKTGEQTSGTWARGSSGKRDSASLPLPQTALSILPCA